MILTQKKTEVVSKRVTFELLYLYLTVHHLKARYLVTQNKHLKKTISRQRGAGALQESSHDKWKKDKKTNVKLRTHLFLSIKVYQQRSRGIVARALIRGHKERYMFAEFHGRQHEVNLNPNPHARITTSNY